MEVYQSLLSARDDVSDIARAIVAAHIGFLMLGAVPRPSNETTNILLSQEDDLYTYFGPVSLRDLCNKEQATDGVFCALRYNIYDADLHPRLITVSLTCIDGSLIIAQVVEVTETSKKPLHCGTVSSLLDDLKKANVFDPRLAIMTFRDKFREVLSMSSTPPAAPGTNTHHNGRIVQSCNPLAQPPQPPHMPHPGPLPMQERPPYGLGNIGEPRGYPGMLVGPDHRIFQAGLARFDPIRPENPFDNPNLHPDPDDIRGVIARRRFDFD